MATESHINNKRIFKNTLFLYIRMFIIMLVGLFTSRVTLSVLGVDDYGIYNVVGGIVVLFSFLSAALNSATQRFLSVELGKGNINGYKSVFNSSIKIYLIISLIIVVAAETIGLWFLNYKMSFPEGRLVAANWVYQFSILSFIINMLKTPFNASIIANEHMSFYTYTSIVETILKLLVVYLLYIGSFDKLILYSFLITTVIVIIFLWYIFYCLKHFEGCKFSRYYDKNLYKQIFSFSGWSLLGSLAVVGTNQGINILLNIFNGVAVNASMGIGNQVASMVNQFTTNFQVAFNPQLTKGYANKNHEYMELVYRASRISFFLLFLISMPFFIKAEFILDLWLEEVPAYTSVFCKFILLSMLVETLSAPLYMVVQASGNIKKYQMMVSLLLSLNFILSYVFLSLRISPTIVVIIRCVVSFALLSYRVTFVTKLLEIPFTAYFKNVIIRVLFASVSCYAICALIQYNGESLIY